MSTWPATPSDVFIVRCASGVTTISELAVGGPSSAGATEKSTPDGAEVVHEHGAELVVADLADERGASAAGRPRRPSVFAAEPPDASMPGGIAAYSSSARSRLDELHRVLRQAVLDEEGVVDFGDHVDDGIADRDHVIGRIRHGR